MSLKRFYRETAAGRIDGRITVTLDGRPVRTPLHKPLHLPTEALADAIAAEWDAQVDAVKPDTMPLTQFASTAIDRVSERRDGVIDDIAGYGRTDLLCYRAEAPPALVARQAKTWQPLLDWAAQRFDATLIVTEGVMAIEQPPAALAALRAAVAAQDEFRLAALHDLTAALGSVVLALAVEQQKIDSEAAWDASILDELWQAEQWGQDRDAEERRDHLRLAVFAAARFLSLLQAR
jgi:chaperone required for assembly of F1-ATPase